MPRLSFGFDRRHFLSVQHQVDLRGPVYFKENISTSSRH
jgi:hypothetical protein